MTTPTSAPTELLFSRGTLMDLFIGKPTFQKKLRPSDVLLEGIDPNAIYLGHKKLLPKKALEELVTVEGQARRSLSDRSLEFPISGARFVQYTALADVIRELTALKETWVKAVEALINDYPALREQQLAILDQQADTLVRQELAKVPGGKEREAKEAALDTWLSAQKALNRSLYPKADDLKGMFRFEWRMFRVSATNGTEELTGLKAEEIAAAQEAIQQDLQRWVRRASMEMHKVLGEAALNAKNLLEKNNKLNPRNLRPLFDAFETFKAVDFTGSSTIQDVIGEIQRRFSVTDANGESNWEAMANTVNGQTGSEAAFSQLLNQVAALAADDVAENAGLEALTRAGEFRRMVDI